MKRYAIKEIYYTLQGEGAQAGRAAVFCRFAGCNLWSGLESGRQAGPGGCSTWCDTNFVGTDGPGGGTFDSAQSVAQAVRECWEGDWTDGEPLVVCTGGEPLLQLDSQLIDALHRSGFKVAVETNGTLPLPEGLDWVCVSPKAGATLVVSSGDELKLVFPQRGAEPERYGSLRFGHWFLQPQDGPARLENTRASVEYCRAHPRWRLSLQTHKLAGIP